MSHMQELLAAIQKRLPVEPEKPSLVVDVELIWARKLGSSRGQGVLVVTTARELTTEGGNGWTGLDGIDMNMIDAAITHAVADKGATGIVDRFIVRGKRRHDTLSDAQIDALFD